MRHVVLVMLVGVLFITGCFKSITPTTGSVIVDTISQPETGKSFTKHDGETCLQDGKPIVRLFATTWCPHCQWVRDTYMKVVQDYVNKGLIVAHLWEVDIGDDVLTSETETAVPESELSVFHQVNPDGSIPTFVFGCKYTRVGNAYEAQKDLVREEKELRAVLDILVREHTG